MHVGLLLRSRAGSFGTCVHRNHLSCSTSTWQNRTGSVKKEETCVFPVAFAVNPTPVEEMNAASYAACLE